MTTQELLKAAADKMSKDELLTIIKTISTDDLELELQQYKKDEVSFKTYQASGLCLFIGNFRQYCKKYKLYSNIVRLP